MKAFSARPLHVQIISITGLVFVALIGPMLWGANRTRLEHEVEVREQAASMAHLSAGYLAQYFESLDTLAASLVRHPAVSSFDRAASDELFSAVLRTQPFLLNIVLTDAAGTIRGTGRPLPATTRPPGESGVVAQVRRSGRPLLAPFTPPSAGASPMVIQAYPAGGGVLGLAIDLRELGREFADIPLPAGSLIVISDESGRVLAATQHADSAIAQSVALGPMPEAGSTPVVRRAILDGVSRYYGDVLVARGPWRVSVGIAESEVMERVFPIWRRNAAVAFGGLIAVLGLSLWLSRSTSRELAAIEEATARIASGDLTPPAPRLAPNQEIARLQTAFRAMAISLKDAHDALDARVEDVMTASPKTIRPDQLASETLELLNSSKITALFAVEDGKPVGIVHLHDLLRAGVA